MKTLFFALLLITFSSSAQNCKFDKDEIDKFTKQRRIEKEVKVSGAGMSGDSYLVLNFCKYDTLLFFRITWIRKRTMVVGPSDPLTFLLEDGNTVKAFPLNIYSSTSRSSTNQEVLSATYNFENLADYEKLKSQKVVSVRINYNQVYTDTNVKEKYQEDLMKAAKCVF